MGDTLSQCPIVDIGMLDSGGTFFSRADGGDGERFLMGANRAKTTNDQALYSRPRSTAACAGAFSVKTQLGAPSPEMAARRDHFQALSQ
jgi:hypothetical protein